MTYSSKDRFSSCEVAGAVAEAAIHDLRVNRFTFTGFPQIHVPVSAPIDPVLKITLSWNASTESKVCFELTQAEAKTAVKFFKDGSGYDRAIFDRVQTALKELEDKFAQDSQRRDRTPMSEPA